MNKLFTILLAFSFLACSQEKISFLGVEKQLPKLIPDYVNVTLPPNIAPINFSVNDSSRATYALLIVPAASAADTLILHASGQVFDFAELDWQQLLQENKGSDIEVILCRKDVDGWTAFPSFFLNIAAEDIDPVLVYRRIPPGYGTWNEMGLYQRDLTSYDEKAIYTNREGIGNCINCHSFCNYQAEPMLFHLRGKQAGTYLLTNGERRQLPIDNRSLTMPVVYPAWHPSGNYIAFSQNSTFQSFYTKHQNRIEVIDDSSNVAIYDVEKQMFINAPQLRRSDSFETFPAFSPDGRKLYFSSAAAVDSLPQRMRQVRYSLCAIDFDAEKGVVGESVDTLYNARTQSGSVSFPRPSPCGRWLVYTLSDYGNFSVWHTEADLYIVDLQSGAQHPMTNLNSPNVESYHSWSSNSRWLVFSSRRDDGLYTRPYIAYIDTAGQARKPFVLPQPDAAHYYEWLMDSYNVPELIKSKVID